MPLLVLIISCPNDVVLLYIIFAIFLTLSIVLSPKIIDELGIEKALSSLFTNIFPSINNIVFSDDEKILELAQTIFDEIKVESIKKK